MANSADPDQLASSEANWSGSTLFAKAGYIGVQQDKGSIKYFNCLRQSSLVMQAEFWVQCSLECHVMVKYISPEPLPLSGLIQQTTH